VDTNKIEHKKLYQAQLFITRAMPDKAIPILLGLLEDQDLDPSIRTFSTIYLTEAYRQKLEYKKGKRLLRKLLLQSTLSIYNRALIYNRLAASFHEQKDIPGLNRIDSLLKYSYLSLEISKKNNFKDLIASSQNELGQYYRRTLHNDTIAIDYLNKALNSFIQMEMYRNAFYVAFNLSHSYMNLDSADKALEALDLVKDLLPHEGNNNFFMYWHEKVGKVYNTIGDYKKSFYHIEKAYSYQRDYFNHKTRTRIREMIAKYDLATKEQEIYKEQQSVKNLIILVIVLSLIAAMIFYNLNLKKKLVRSQNEKLKIQLESKNRELMGMIGNMIGINKAYKEIKKALETDTPEEILSILNQNVNTEENWHKFKFDFENIYPDFYPIIREKFPQLSKNDLKLAALLLMKLSTPEIAEILNISPSSVSKRRNRFRNKLGIEARSNLHLFIKEAYESQAK
jgi:DNA-binding CsgD family transcriptional regulator